MLFGVTIGSLIGRYSSKLRAKDVDDILDNSWDEINSLIDLPRNEMYMLGSKQRLQDVDFDNINKSIDTGWQDDVLKTIDDSGGYKYIRNVFKFPMGLESSRLDESYDLVNVLVNSNRITKKEIPDDQNFTPALTFLQ